MECPNLPPNAVSLGTTGGLREIWRRSTASCAGEETDDTLPVMAMKNLLTTSEVREYLGVSEDTWNKWRGKGTGPAMIRLPNRELRISEEELAAWLETQREDANA